MWLEEGGTAALVSSGFTGGRGREGEVPSNSVGGSDALTVHWHVVKVAHVLCILSQVLERKN